jgi:hypothetical protein
VEARPANPIAYALFGEPVLKRRRRHCDARMPKTRREHGLRPTEAARKALAACSRMRAGAKAPHPRHWDVLAMLLE